MRGPHRTAERPAPSWAARRARIREALYPGEPFCPLGARDTAPLTVADARWLLTRLEELITVLQLLELDSLDG